MRFAAKDRPRSDIFTGTGIDLLEGFAEAVEFEDLNGNARIDSGEAVGEYGGLAFG